MIGVVAHHKLPELGRALERYAALSGRSIENILDFEAKRWMFGLWEEFRKIRPEKGAIARAAESRGWRMGRRTNSYVQAVRGISVAAWERAKTLLEGESTDLFKMRAGKSPGRVRFSSRKGNKILQGGRFGNRFAASALRASQLPADEVASRTSAYPTPIRRLNVRALAVMAEIQYRQRAAGGGFLALQWLHRTYAKRKSSVVKSGPLIQNTRDGRMVGRVDFMRSRDGITASIKGYIPGTAKQMLRHSITQRVLSDRLARRQRDIEELVSKAAKKAGLKRG